MTAPRRWTATIAAICASALVAAGAAADPRDAAPRPLTGPRAGDPKQIGLEYLLGGGAGARAARSTQDEYRLGSERRSLSGVTSLVLRQYRHGLEVWKGSLAVHVDALGRVLRADDRSEPASPARRSRSAATRHLTPVEATLHAFDQLGLAASEEIRVLAEPAGAEHATRLGGGGAARDGIAARLMWLPGRHRPDGNGAPGPDATVWNLWIQERRGGRAWEVNVDAVSGLLLTQHDRVRHDRYRVYAEPADSPNGGARTLVLDPADPVASPFGWHDTNAVPGAEFTTTRGNNASAAEDRGGDDEDTAGASPDGGAGLDFDFPIADLDVSPELSEDAAITNAFYWVNRLHDVFYRFGFDEASGNFQQQANGNPTLSNDADAVRVDVLDGWDTGNPTLRNNASFFTPPDGSAPRMELHVWTDFRPRVRIDTPVGAADSMPAGVALFGPNLESTGVSGQVAIAVDTDEGPDNTALDGCSPILNAAEIAGKVALLNRGQCDFVVKVGHAEGAGAVAAVIVNRESSDLVSMSRPPENTQPITIPSLLIGRHNGDRLAALAPIGASVTLRQPAIELERDGAFSSGTIAHEYGHGVTHRLTGGGFTTTCLDNNQAISMGEGWSDFFELVMTARPGESPSTRRTTATFLEGEGPQGAGIRRFPYTTSESVNPLVYSDVADAASEGPIREHDGGEIWAAALWEVYWNLVNAHGFEPEFHEGYTGSADGNALALQLVVDGLALQPCEPSFLDARDAMLQADVALTGGANACHLWRGFAARGMGVSADDGGSSSSLAVTDAFDVPEPCPEPGTALLQAAALLGIGALRSARSRRRTR